MPGKNGGHRHKKLAANLLCASRSLAPPRQRLLLALLLTGAQLAFATPEHGDITDIPFEKLLATEIITAARLAKQVSDAPSAVSIVTAQDIRQYGYRSLTDILNGMRGLYVTQGPFYGLLGGRGYGTPADFAGRVTVLINGYKTQDNFWGQSFFGSDGLLDTELIERVEYIPGPGSSSHGDSAFLGVVNIITRQGRDLDGFTLSREWGAHGWQKNRLTYGKRFASGLDIVFSTSDYHRDGRTPLKDEGDETRYENEKARRHFIQAAYGGWQFESGWAKRTALTNKDSAADENAYASLKHDRPLDEGLRLSTHAYWGQYLYTDKLQPASPWGTTGRWSGIDLKLVNSRHEHHTLVVGAEYRNDYRQDVALPEEPLQHYARRTFSLYAYDDIRLGSTVQLNLGARLDRRNNGSQTLSPRGAIIYSPVEGRTLKLSSGIAHRQPTQDIEAFVPDRQIPLVERLTTNELVWEEQLTPRTRLLASFYGYRLDDSYTWNADGHLMPNKVRVHGQELEVEHVWESGAHLRGSFARQAARNSNGHLLTNVPASVGKLNFAIPLWGERLRLGTAVRYVSKRPDWHGDKVPGATITDLTLSGKWPSGSFVFSARNVFNKVYPEIAPYGFYPIDGRNYWLQLNLELK